MVLPRQTDLRYETKKLSHTSDLFHYLRCQPQWSQNWCKLKGDCATAHASLAYWRSKRQSKNIHRQRSFICSGPPTRNCPGINNDGKHLSIMITEQNYQLSIEDNGTLNICVAGYSTELVFHLIIQQRLKITADGCFFFFCVEFIICSVPSQYWRRRYC